MVDEPIPAAAAPSALPATPEASAPVTTPAATSSAQASSEAAPAASTAAQPSEPAKIPQTLLSGPAAEAKAPEIQTPPADAAKDDAKPESEKSKAPEAEKPVEPVKEEASKSDAPAPLPTYEPWTLPEGITLDEKQSTEFSSLLGDFQNSTKADQAEVQKFGQTLIDRYVANTTETVQRLHEAYQNAWVSQTEGWKEAFIKDPEIGGKRQETSVQSANEFITTHGGNAEQQVEFRKLMGVTGIGNHPAMIRMLANAMTKFSESRQPAPMHFAPERQSKSSKWYGKKPA